MTLVGVAAKNRERYRAASVKAVWPDVAHPAIEAVRARRAELMQIGFTGAEGPADPERSPAQRRS